MLKIRRARASFTEFCRYIEPDEPPAVHHQLLCETLQKVAEGEIPNLMVFMPPGSAKSTYSSVRFPPWYLGNNPKKDLIQASNTAELAQRFGRKTRNIVDSPDYRVLFDVKLAKDSQAKGQWEVIPGDDAAGGEYYAVGVDGTVTGRRADGGIIDDPVKGREDADSQRTRDKQWDWYLTDFCTRIKPGGFKIIIQTRWHEDDLSGRILPEDWSGESGPITARDGEPWYVLCLPAQAGKNDPLGRSEGDWLWPEWFTDDFWGQTKARMLPRDWLALYQQTPTADEGLYFAREDFKRFRLGEEPKHLHRYVTSDFAVTESSQADFTVFGDWGLDHNGDWWLLNRYKEQTTADKWVSVLASWFKAVQPFTFFGEGGQIRRAIEPLLEREMRDQGAFTTLHWFTRTTDKQATAQGFRGMCKQGKIHIPLTEWGEDLIAELIKFPAGTHDDQVDMCALVGLAVNQGVLAMPPETPEEVFEPDDYLADEIEDSDHKLL